MTFDKILLFMKEQACSFLFCIKNIWIIRKRIFFLCIVESLINSFTVFLWAYFLKFLLDALSLLDIQGSISWVCFCLLITAISEVFKRILSIEKEKSYFHVNTRLKLKMYDVGFNIPFEAMENPETINQMDMASKCISQNCIATYMSSVTNAVSCWIVLFGIGIVVPFEWYVTAILVLVVIISSACRVFQARYEMQQFNEETVVSRQLEYTRFWMTEKSRAKEVRSYVLYDFVVDKLKEYNEKFFNVLMLFTKKQKRAYGLIYIISGLQFLFVYLYASIWLFDGSSTVGEFTLNTSLLFSFGRSFESALISVINLYKNHFFVSKLRDFFSRGISTKGKAEIEEGFDLETIEFRNVYFKYPGVSEWAIENVSFTLKKGEKLSLIGENGAGKTTLIKLLTGVYSPTSGDILINGLPISWYAERLHSIFGVVFQDFFIFDFTVGENITMKDLDNSVPSELVRRLEIENIDLERHISCTFSGDGINLSGGESQKVAMARALNKESSVIILDEPTSALSPASEYSLYKVFNKITNGKTVVFISHRLSSCRICDKILLLENGRVNSVGSHDELFGNCDKYREMFLAQAEFYLESDTGYKK